jgi:hypothetical protein
LHLDNQNITAPLHKVLFALFSKGLDHLGKFNKYQNLGNFQYEVFTRVERAKNRDFTTQKGCFQWFVGAL